LKITGSVGLDFSAKEQWIFRDEAHTWWMLPDYSGEIVRSDDDIDHPNCSSLRQKKFRASDAPMAFIGDLGGMDGPLEWALVVLEHCFEARETSDVIAKRLSDFQRLTAIPEWTAFVEVAKRRGDLAINRALNNLGHYIDQGGVRNALKNAYRRGFHAGEVMGYVSATGALKASEAARNPGKTGLDRLLWKIICLEGDGDPKKVKPYVLAGQLIEDRDTGNARGRELADLGLASSSKKLGERIGRLIKKNAQSPDATMGDYPQDGT